MMWRCALGPERLHAIQCHPDPRARAKEKAITFPQGRIYKSYIADPLMHLFSVSLIYAADEKITDTSRERRNLKLGGSFPFMLLVGSGWQFSLEAGFNMQSDLQESFDVIGWDDVAGLLATKRIDHGLSFRLSPWIHRSAHLGDEIVERTGRTRIDYTREEVLGGLTWEFHEDWRLYGDAGADYTRRSEYQETWRVQGGVEWIDPDALPEKGAGLRAALNATSFQETDWDIALSAATGVLVRVRERDWRFGVAFHHRAVPLGEFFQSSETYIRAGVWLDI